MSEFLLDPTAELAPTERQLVPRLQSLEGATTVSYTHLTLPTIYSV